MDGKNVIVFFTVILVVAVLFLIAIKLTGKRKHKFNVEEYQTRFLTINNNLNKDVPSTFMATIIDADKLLDHALIEMGVPGKTMGDRLKRIGGKFSDINGVWRVHKLRNALAHESDASVSHRQAVAALAVYRQALKDLGAI
ncbi:MAG: hypothetical protein Q4A79_01880 [Candidatus Saccharibacteria bacterium]|nr:hypothetical protein [Candidatus Saccharibacteria bacterium]